KTPDPMCSLRAKLLIHSIKLTRSLLRPEQMPVARMRAGMEALMQQLPSPAFMHVQLEHWDNLPVRIVSGLAQPNASLGMLYLHGGGYGMGSSRSHQKLAARIGQRFGGKLYLPDYRLAPEHPFPAAIEDAVQVWKMLPERHPEVRTWVLAGDSAGGG